VSWLKNLFHSKSYIPKTAEEELDEMTDLLEEVYLAMVAEDERIKELETALRDVGGFNSAVAGGYCWCNTDNKECLTAACIKARTALG